MKTAKSIIVVLFVLLTAQIAFAYYCPSTGRWLSRDPIGEPGFQALLVAGQTSIRSTSLPSSDRWIIRDSAADSAFLTGSIQGLSSKQIKQLRAESLMPVYGFVANNPISRHDHIGLHWTGIPDHEFLPIDYFPNLCKCRSMVHDAMWDASDWANNTLGVPGHMHSNSGSPADMMSHCVGACEVAKGEAICKKVGLDPRKYLQDREHGGKNAADKLDLENNQVGFGIADSGQDCKSGCFKALQEGKLWTESNGEAHPYTPPATQPPTTGAP